MESIEAVAPETGVDTAPAVETFTEGRDSSPPSSETNGHDRSEPTTIQGWREERKKAREDAEQRATAQAEVSKLSESERQALSRRTVNPLYAEHDLAQSLDPAEIERLGLQNAKAPPDADQEYEELKSRLDDLDPKDKASALSHLAQLQRSRAEAKRAEIEATTRNVQNLHEQNLAAFTAQATHINMVDQQMQATFEQTYGVPMSMQGIEYLQANSPELAAPAMQAMLTCQAQRQEAQEYLAQNEQANAASEQWSAGAEDQLFNQRMRASDPDLFNSSGQLKPEIGAGVLDYVKSFGIGRDDFKQMLSSNVKVPIRSHQMQQLIVDAARYRMAKSKAAEAKKAPPVTVQKPGEPTGFRSTYNDDKIAALEAKGDRGGLSLREASKLQLMKMRRDRT
jgi:hypothetical protein